MKHLRLPARSRGSAPPSRGFTLIELLVVIAIIAILAAILFPVFQKVRENARKAACLSNLKQISVALTQYTQDSDEQVPYIFYGTNGGGSAPNANYKWMDAIYPFIKSEAVFNCPDAVYPNVVGGTASFYPYHYYQNLSGLTPAAAANGSGTGNFYYGSYGLNAMYRNDNISFNRTPPCGQFGLPQSISAFQAPANTVWIVDGTNYYAGWGQLTGQPSPIINTAVSPRAFNGNGNELVVGRHTDRCNVMYCDGHVKSMTLDSLITPQRADGTLINFVIAGS